MELTKHIDDTDSGIYLDDDESALVADGVMAQFAAGNRGAFGSFARV